MVWDLLGSPRLIWDRLGSSKLIWGRLDLGSFAIVWALGSSGVSWDRLPFLFYQGAGGTRKQGREAWKTGEDKESRRLQLASRDSPKAGILPDVDLAPTKTRESADRSAARGVKEANRTRPRRQEGGRR